MNPPQPQPISSTRSPDFISASSEIILYLLNCASLSPWCSDAKIKHAHFIQNELNIEECRVNCRMNQINTYLDSVVNKDQEHVNFI